MRKLIRMLFLFSLFLLLTTLPALAEDVCTVEDASAVSHVTTDRTYLRVCCPLDGETCVTLSVEDEWGYLIYQRSFGACSGTFRSEEVYLPLEGERTDYTVTLATDTQEHVFRVTREQPMLTDSAVYAAGLTLDEMNGGSSRKYAVVLDLDALNEETLTVPMLAGGMQIGYVHFSVLDGVVTVTADLIVDGEIDKASVCVAPDALTADTLGSNRFTGMKTKLNREIDLTHTPYAAVMVQLTVSYDAATAQAWRMGREEQEAYEEQLENWQLMQLTTANEAVG